MFDRFGEFGSAQEINETAAALRKEKDYESLKILAVGRRIEGEANSELFF